MFGLTPWGRYFIEAMEALADDGRLARGRAYAGNGSVLKLTVDGGNVRARVSGNYAPYYDVAIRFKPLPGPALATVRAAFASDLLLRSRVAAGDLPDGLVARLEKKGASLVPRRWSEIERSCSCPDYGDPCKHQAAVYYLLAQEIDRDPLVLFRLRGVDIDGAEAKGTVAEPIRTLPVPDPVNPRLVAPWPDPQPEDGDPLSGLGGLSNYTAAIPSLLPPSRGLAPFDLRVVCAAFYMKAAGRIPEIIEPAGLASLDGGQARCFAASRFEVRLGADGTASIETAIGGKLGLLAASKAFLTCAERQGSPSYRFLRAFFQAARSIASASAFVPDVRLCGDRFSVLWRPARFASDVDALLRALEPLAISPTWKIASPVPASPEPLRTPKAATARVPDAKSTIELLAMAYLTELAGSVGFSLPSSRENEHPTVRALFGRRQVSCAAPGQRALPGALDAWLSVYTLASSRPPLELAIAAARRGDASADTPRFRLSAACVGEDGSRVALKSASGVAGERAAQAMSFAAMLSNFVPALGRLGVSASVTLGQEELAGFVIDAAPLLGRLGVSLVLPRELRALATPRPAIRAARKASLGSFLDLATAFTFDWSVAIGDERLSPAEFASMLSSGLRLVRWRNEWVRLDPAEAARLLSRVSGKAAPGALEAMRAALSGDVETESDFSDAIQRLVGTAGRGDVEIRSPSSLKATLRPYQERGFRWMLGNFERGLGCLLADDMGLGKTVQAIAAMLSLKDAGSLGSGALVCAPASLLSNWERELSRFAPSLTVCPYYGTARRRRAADVTLSSYETMIRDQKKLAGFEWNLVVLDEAHYIKNPDSRRARTVKSLRAERRLALTGTPVENNLAELWSLFDWILPGYLGTQARFADEFRKPIELDRSELSAGRLRRATAPFVMRRLKTDKAIAADLPDKVVVDEYASLTPGQAALYEAVASEGLARVSSAGSENRLGVVLAMITALKQVSNHPRNYDKESPGTSDASGKTRLLVALLEAAFEAGERVLVFSQYVEMLGILEGVVRDELGVEPYMLHGGLSRKRRDEAVDRFQNERGPGVFLVSLKAGGVGLNLTAATRVVHYDLWFNPAVENQATDRAFRIGQTRNVFVHRLIARDTIEERIDAMIASKRELSELTVRAGESWISKLGDDELRDLVSLR